MKDNDPNDYHQKTTKPAKDNGDKTISAAGLSVKKGDTLLGLYKVEDGPIVGGMGRVFCVRHTGWNTLLAMKQPIQFLNEEQKQAFIHECNAWIKLDLHPHIVYCHYVREINGIPSIFTEWMDGGSLKEAITSGTLYKNGNETTPERILDISIQTARGLHYAHEQGLIHQDVKPENLLLSKTGEAKVADFGISNAKTIIKEAKERKTSSEIKTIISKAGSYTLAYCSPEQIEEKELTRRTDIWSWALSVLEMFTGKRQWSNGAEAGKDCGKYFEMGRIPIPEAGKDLLRHCFCENEAERPYDFREIEKTLLVIYKEETGKEYWRPEPKAVANTAGNLNNKALSYLDLGKPEEAERCWEQALLTDPAHAESLYNQSVHLWKSAKIDDMKVLYIVSSNSSEITDCYLAKIHLSRGDAESALTCLNKAKDIFGETDDIRKMAAAAHEMIERGKDGRCIRTFERDNKYILSVCFSPDEKEVLSGGEDKTIKLWEVETGKCIRTFEGHGGDGYIFSVCFSPDGKTALSGSEDKTIKLWEVETGICIRTFEGHHDDIRSVCFSPDGKTALSGSEDKTIKLWEVETGICIRTFEGHHDDIRSVCFSPDGKTVLSGSSDKTIKRWEVETGKCIRTFKGHNKVVRSVCFSPDGKVVLSGSWDHTIKLWEVETGKHIRTFTGHNSAVMSVCFSPDGKTVLSSDNDIKLWEMETGICIRTFKGNTDRMRSARFSSDGKTVLSGSSDKTIKLYLIPDKLNYEMIISEVVSTGKTRHHAELFDFLAAEVNSFIRKGDITVALNTLRKIPQIPLFGNSTAYYTIKKSVMRYCVCDKITNQKKRTILQNTGSVCLSPDGKTALSADYDETIKLWAVETGTCIRTFEGHYKYIPLVCFSPNGKTALSGNHDKSLKLWKVETGTCLHTLEGHSGLINSVCFNPNGKAALSGSEDKTIKLWEVETGTCIRTFEGHDDYIYSVGFSPDGKTALSGSHDETLKLWEVETGKCIRTFKGRSDDGFIKLREAEETVYIRLLKGYGSGIESVCFSPDGKTALSGGQKNLELWNVATGKCIHTFEGHNGAIRSVCFSADGKTMLSGSSDKTIKLWDVKTGKCIHTFERHTGSVQSVCFNLDGTRIISGGGREIIIYDLDYELSFPGWADWDEGARPYLDIFLTLHPHWTDEDFDTILIPELQRRGYGWLRPEGVRVKLEELT